MKGRRHTAGNTTAPSSSRKPNASGRSSEHPHNLEQYKTGRATSIGAVVLDAHGRVLIVKKYWTKNWEFPQGVREGGEPAQATLRREMREEVGITRYHIDPAFHMRIYYAFRFLGKYPVQKTVIYHLLRVRSSAVKLSEEHTAYHWLRPERALRYFRHENFRKVMRNVISFERHRASV